MEILRSETELDYALYACDFDPEDASRLVVGGGGGVYNSGVANKISLLTIPNQDKTVHHTSEIELSKKEDNVTSLAVGHTRGRSTLVYAGINSNPEEQKKGNNEHFRVFGVDPQSKTKSPIPPAIEEIARRKLFTSTDANAYQRLLRLSPSYEGSTQVGACATGLSDESEIAIFDVPSSTSPGPKPRGLLNLKNEASDLDIIQTGDNEYLLAYCDSYSLYTHTIKEGVTEEPRCVFTIPDDQSTGPRPSFRSLRFLTPTFLLAASNLPKRTGVALQGFRLPAKADENARLAVSAKLPKAAVQATSLAVCNLSPPASPTAKQGDCQFAIAVVGVDGSIYLYTLEHQVVSSVDLIVSLFPFSTLPKVHDAQVTGLALSRFQPPAIKSTSRTQYVRLASVAVDCSVRVHHIPLKKIMDSSAAVQRGGPPRQPRYVVAMRSRGGPAVRTVLLVVSIGMVLLAILAQASLEVTGLSEPVVHARRFVPRSWQSDMAPRFVRGVPGVQGGKLAELLAERKLDRDDGGAALLVRENAEAGEHGIEVTTTAAGGDEDDGQEQGLARTWEELPAEQRAAWRERLQRAGHWGEDMGETVLKGVLFSELAGVVGAIVGN